MSCHEHPAETPTSVYVVSRIAAVLPTMPLPIPVTQEAVLVAVSFTLAAVAVSQVGEGDALDERAVRLLTDKLHREVSGQRMRDNRAFLPGWRNW